MEQEVNQSYAFMAVGIVCFAFGSFLSKALFCKPKKQIKTNESDDIDFTDTVDKSNTDKNAEAEKENAHSAKVNTVLSAIQKVTNDVDVTDFEIFKNRLNSMYGIEAERGKEKEVNYSIIGYPFTVISCWDILKMRGSQYFFYDMEDLQCCFDTNKSVIKRKYNAMTERKFEINKFSVSEIRERGKSSSSDFSSDNIAFESLAETNE